MSETLFECSTSIRCYLDDSFNLIQKSQVFISSNVDWCSIIFCVKSSTPKTRVQIFFLSFFFSFFSPFELWTAKLLKLCTFSLSCATAMSETTFKYIESNDGSIYPSNFYCSFSTSPLSLSYA